MASVERVTANTLKKGSIFIFPNGKACKITQLNISKPGTATCTDQVNGSDGTRYVTGKHGSSKMRITGSDVFSGSKHTTLVSGPKHHHVFKVLACCHMSRCCCLARGF